jgi:hypothetical protein
MYDLFKIFFRGCVKSISPPSAGFGGKSNFSYNPGKDFRMQSGVCDGQDPTGLSDRATLE